MGGFSAPRFLRPLLRSQRDARSLDQAFACSIASLARRGFARWNIPAHIGRLYAQAPLSYLSASKSLFVQFQCRISFGGRVLLSGMG
jgi:hypothetical protein